MYTLESGFSRQRVLGCEIFDRECKITLTNCGLRITRASPIDLNGPRGTYHVNKSEICPGPRVSGFEKLAFSLKKNCTDCRL